MKIVGLVVVMVTALAGCTGTLPPVPDQVSVPVGKPCLTPDQVPHKPDFVTDAQLAKKSDDAIVYSLGADRLARQDYEGKLEAVISGCVGVKVVPQGVDIPKETDRSWLDRLKFWK